MTRETEGPLPQPTLYMDRPPEAAGTPPSREAIATARHDEVHLRPAAAKKAWAWTPSGGGSLAWVIAAVALALVGIFSVALGFMGT